MFKIFKGSVFVVRDLLGKRGERGEREKVLVLRFDFMWGNGKNREIMFWIFVYG